MLKKILFTTFFVFGCSLVAFGQKNDPPPKKDPPTIKIPPKPTPTPTPTPKKPNLVEVGSEAKAFVVG